MTLDKEIDASIKAINVLTAMLDVCESLKDAEQKQKETAEKIALVK